jgi:hypothetical protein
MKKFLLLLAAVSATMLSLSTCSTVKDALTEDCVYSREVPLLDPLDLKCETVPIKICEEGLPGGIKGRIVTSCDDFDFSDANMEYCKFEESNTDTELKCERIPKGKCEDYYGKIVESCD